MSSVPPRSPVARQWAIIIVLLGGITVAFAWRYLESEPAPVTLAPDISIPLPPFSFTERGGRSVTHADLMGKTWIADFVFTHCAGPCPLMTRHMRDLQEDLADVEALQLVSFSVDPERDTPAVLSAYADRHGADARRWWFLTGPMDDVYDMAIKGFRITVEAARENQEIIHDTRFILVDRSGHIRGYYESTTPEELDRLRGDARKLAGR